MITANPTALLAAAASAQECIAALRQIQDQIRDHQGLEAPISRAELTRQAKSKKEELGSAWCVEVAEALGQALRALAEAEAGKESKGPMEAGRIFPGLNMLQPLDMDSRLYVTETLIGKDNPTKLTKFADLSKRAEAIVTGNPALPCPDAFTLLRFLDADGENVDKAELRLRATLAWWSERRIEDMLRVPPAGVQLYERLRVRRWTGFTRDGKALMVERLGEFFGSDNHKAFTKEEWLTLYSHDMLCHSPQFCEASRRAGRPILRYHFIGDCRGLRFFAAMRAVPLLKFLTKQVERHYPEIAGDICLVGVPSALAMIYNKVVKRFLDPAVAAKVELHSGIPSAHLIKKYGPDCLPVEWGGSSPVAVPHVEVFEGATAAAAAPPPPSAAAAAAAAATVGAAGDRPGDLDSGGRGKFVEVGEDVVWVVDKGGGGGKGVQGAGSEDNKAEEEEEEEEEVAEEEPMDPDL